MDNAYCVILDTNAWVAERLLQSSLGSALLYALTAAQSQIGLPEIIEDEANTVLRNMAERAVELIRREQSLLRQLSGQEVFIAVPTSLAIDEGITRRWAHLEGILSRVPFSHEQARAALRRVSNKIPPSGENNEQFRDSCIWESALTLASDKVVHLISADSAFYEGRTYSRGLNGVLSRELASAGRDVRLYPSIRDFLAVTDLAIATLDEKVVGEAIQLAVTPAAHDIASEDGGTLGPLFAMRIQGYATPRPAVVAVSFDAGFQMTRPRPGADSADSIPLLLRVAGVCTYDPNTCSVSEVELRGWSKSIDSPEYLQTSVNDAALRRQFSPTHTRFVR